MTTKRIRCDCGRVYDPVKRSACPDCGAASPVLAPPEPPLANEPQLTKRSEGEKKIPAPPPAAPHFPLRYLVIGGAAVLCTIALFMCVGHKGGADKAKRNESPPPASATPSASATAIVQRETPKPAPSVPEQITPPPSGIPIEQFDLAAAIANASPGATIKVPPGSYPGGLVISRPVHVVGQNAFIQSEGREGASVKSTGVKLENLQFFGKGIGELPSISVADGAEMELDGCKVQSSSALAVSLKGKASIKATGSSFAAENGTAIRLNGGHGNLTQCTFSDTLVGVAVSNGGTIDLHSCAFERNGGNEMNGAIVAGQGDKTTVTANDCHFTDNYAGLGIGNSASFTISNSSFKHNIQTARGGNAAGLFLVRARGQLKLENVTFEGNGEGVAVREGGTVEMQKCQFEANGGRQTGHDIVGSYLPLSVVGNNSSATIRGSLFMNSTSYAMNVAAGASLTLEDSEVSASGSVGLVVGDRASPGHADIRRSHFLGNGTGLGIFAGSSANIEDSEFRENHDGIIALDNGTRLTIAKSKLLANREFGLSARSGAQVTATDCEIQDNNKGAQSGTAHKQSDRASLTLENCRFARNKTFAAGACVQSELTLKGCTFDSDKTNIFKERGGIVQSDGDGDASAQTSPEPSTSDEQSHRKKATRNRGPSNEEIYRMIRRFRP